MNKQITSKTFQQNYNIKFNEIVNSIAVDKTGSFVCLGGKKQLQIIDLELLRNVKNILQKSKWEVGVVDWNNTSQNLIASSSNQDAFIWDIENSKYPLLCQITCHTRAVSDLSWSILDRNILATTSADSYIHLWDLRTPNKAMKMKTFCSHILGAIQVKWNKFNPNILASAHESNLMIWDLRKENAELNTTVHSGKIYGIDWSPEVENEILTCSQDKTIKIWSYPNTKPIGIIATNNPVLRAKYLPMGKGIVSISDRGENNIRLWSSNNYTVPVATFQGHTDSIRSFDYRIRSDQKDLQIVSWSKDQYLRLWKLDNSLKYIFGIEPLPESEQIQQPCGGNTQLPTSSESLPISQQQPNQNITSSPTNNISSSISPISSSASLGDHYIEDTQSNHSSTGSNSMNSPILKSSQQHQQHQMQLDDEHVQGCTLEYEFKIIQNKFLDKSLKIEQINLQKRVCVVTCTIPNNFNVFDSSSNTVSTNSTSSTSSSSQQQSLIDSTIVQLRVSFPSLYPNGAVPSFEFLTFACNTDLKTNTSILASLYQVAWGRVTKSLPCFEQCLLKLVFLVKQSVIDRQSSNNNSSILTPTKPIDEQSKNNNNNNNNSVDNIFQNNDSAYSIVLDQNILSFDQSNNSYKNQFIAPQQQTQPQQQQQDDINIRKSNNRIDIPNNKTIQSQQILSRSPSTNSPPNYLNNSSKNNMFTNLIMNKKSLPSANGDIMILNNYKTDNNVNSSSDEPSLPLSPILSNIHLYQQQNQQQLSQWAVSPSNPSSNNSNTNNNNNINSNTTNNNEMISLSSHRTSTRLVPPVMLNLSICDSQPCPRLCGVAFGGIQNRIIIFKNRFIPNSSIGNDSNNIVSNFSTPRTYKELLSLYAPDNFSSQHSPNNQPVSKLLHNNSFNYDNMIFGTPTSPNILGQNLIQSPTLKSQKSNTNAMIPLSPSISSSSAAANTSNVIINNNNNNGNFIVIPIIKMYDNIPSFSPVNEHLAREYILSGHTIEEICTVNQDLVKSANRSDLVKLWSTLRLITDPKLYQRYYNQQQLSHSRKSLSEYTQQHDDNWPTHPLGRPLVQSLMNHYQKIGDFQTLAMISCVLILAAHQLQQTLAQSPPSPPIFSANPSSLDYGNIMQNTTTLAPFSPVFQNYATENTSTATKQQHIQMILNSTSSSTSNSSIIGGSYHMLGESATFRYDLNLCLLDPSKSKVYDQYRHLYAEYLYRYGLLEKRAELLKFTQNVSKQPDSEDRPGIIGFGIDCPKCQRKLNSYYCNHCKFYAFKCSICNNSVRGLSSFCFQCGHGGHTDHIKGWFDKHSKCPTGCGCNCSSHNNTWSTLSGSSKHTPPFISTPQSSSSITYQHVRSTSISQMSSQNSGKYNRRYSISAQDDDNHGGYGGDTFFHEMLNSPSSISSNAHH
ncbi:hypothetical protein DLAC_04388 [Tieghemostelium lacteum]|uniref:WDR59/RTC1-like RING zinc finger domain-containing protein n=1 Tax=Tieghemostelium lacteum TaxID=361077 RepID=A0A151ZJD0_TIELA|nr:hypothetical protein DLAC_04388 [Tieghemostelium lacteum]|eukprot:KYQ94108.1 hypothetical protein DLAC_04388 [Tieghemostelium lacteum]